MEQVCKRPCCCQQTEVSCKLLQWANAHTPADPNQQPLGEQPLTLNETLLLPAGVYSAVSIPCTNTARVSKHCAMVAKHRVCSDVVLCPAAARIAGLQPLVQQPTRTRAVTTDASDP